MFMVGFAMVANMVCFAMLQTINFSMACNNGSTLIKGVCR